MASLALSEVQYLNLMTLTILHETIERDPIEACTTLGMLSEPLDRLEPMPAPERILAAGANAGQESLLALRADAVTLLSRPAPLLAALLSVQSPSPVSTASTPASSR